MSCLYCHNPETQQFCSACGICVSSCPAHALSIVGNTVRHDTSRCIQCDRCIQLCPRFSSPKYHEVSDDAVIQKVLSNQDFLDGITFSGGECTLQYPFLHDVFAAVREQSRLTCFVDTNGFLSNEALDTLLDVTDGFMIDMKAVDSEQHRKLTGVDPAPIRHASQRISKHGKLYEVRTVLVEGYTADEKTVEQIARYIHQLNDYTRFRLIPFRPLGVQTTLRNTPSCSLKKLNCLYDLARTFLGERVTMDTWI